DLIPESSARDPHHSLWVKLTALQEAEPAEITDGYVLAASGDPVTQGALNNQTPLIIRKQSSLAPARYFIINQVQDGSPYNDTEGEAYHWKPSSSGASKQLANSRGARVVYYRPGTATDGTGKTYFGTGRIGTISSTNSNSQPEYLATI